MKRWTAWGMALVVVAATLPAPYALAQAKEREKGLFLTPPRQYLEADPGKTVASSITIANLTENPAEVGLAFEQFSVADYTYDYRFELPKEDWIRFETARASLKKTESRTISYTITVPKNASPGGHYFTLFASMSPVNGKLVRAATVVYVTVSGAITKSSSIVKESLPWVTTGGDIPYQLDVKSRGNTHFLIYVSGRLYGLSAREPKSEVAHLLLPNKVRTVKGSISPPLIPGIYKAEFGFKDEAGHETKRTRYMLYAPPWSWALVIGTIWLILAIRKRRRRLNPASIGS